MRDTRVLKFREDLHSSYQRRYDSLVKALPEDWWPYYGWRSFMEQDALYLKGRDSNLQIIQPKEVVTHAKGGESPHNWGCATDWTVFVNGKPTWDHHRWGEYAAACKRVNLEWGGHWISFSDRPHNELPIRCPWSDILKTRQLKGEAEAMKFLEKMVIF